MDMKANALMKANIDALLKARGQHRRELGRWCLRTLDKRADTWIAKIMGTDREFPMKYFDRISDFFGIATYQLFQPGISPLTERRSRSERRSGQDRRLSAAVLSQKRGDVDLVDIVRAISPEGREKAKGMLADILNDELRGPRTRGSHPVGPYHTGGKLGPGGAGAQKRTP